MKQKDHFLHYITVNSLHPNGQLLQLLQETEPSAAAAPLTTDTPQNGTAEEEEKTPAEEKVLDPPPKEQAPVDEGPGPSLEVPPLPLPDIDATLDRYLDALKAVIPVDQMAETEKLVTEFRQNDDLKQRVDRALEERSQKKQNWVGWMLLKSLNLEKGVVSFGRKSHGGSYH